jgi:hemin uptake protein HemP
MAGGEEKATGEARLVKASAAAGLRRVSAQELMGSHRELIIEHDGQTYRLRITSNGKLILTK